VDPKVGRIVMTPVMLNLQWLSTAFYPAGHHVSRIMIEPSVKLPDGWKFGCALESATTAGNVTTFKPTTFETLMDSPMFAGRHYKQLDLDPNGKVPVRLNLVADRPEFLEVKPEHLEVHRKLVQQAYKLFGSHHYDHYDFLVALSDQLGSIGLEHHRSSENRVTPKYFTEWEKSFVGRDLLSHEFTHSWNGKFRRGVDLWTPNYQGPMRNTLLWVYEGQTQYWGYVLAARAGLMTRQQVLEAIAATAAAYDRRKGREWRNVLDTTHDPIIANRRPLSWVSYQRSEDYYSEGQLIWLDADTLMREKTGDKKSLDDFAKAFFGIEDGSYVPSTYVFDDVVKTLNSIVPHDWASFLKARVEELSEHAPLDGLARGGYRLAYTNAPGEYFKAYETRLKVTHFAYSVGFTVGAGGVLSEVSWGGPAFKVGLTQGVTLVAVNSESYDADKLKDAIKEATKSGTGPIELLIKDGERYRTVKLDYHDGLRYPKLERIPGTPARLDEILEAQK
jgi:predicted metalloprotease with PDZ domain